MTTTTVGKLTVPYMVDATRTPIDFKILDPSRVELCARQARCGICGGKIRRGPIAFIGPADGRTCFADPWMHPACAALAMRQCPFLGGRRDWRDDGARTEPLLATYSRGMAPLLARNWRAHFEPGGWHFQAVGEIAPACAACAIGGEMVPATHASRYDDGMRWCARHAEPVLGDPPLPAIDTSAEGGAADDWRDELW